MACHRHIKPYSVADGCFTHGRAAGEDRTVGAEQAAYAPVKLVYASGYAGGFLALIRGHSGLDGGGGG